MIDLCVRHEALLVEALKQRGLVRHQLRGPEDSYTRAHMAIVEHATHFAGRAALEMLQDTPHGEHHCPLCFINARNPAGLNLDGWVHDAADEQLALASPKGAHV